MFYTIAHGQPDSVRRVWMSYFLQSSLSPLAILIALALFIGVVSELFGLPGKRLALEFISNGTEPIAMVQIFFLAVAYATGPLCLVLDPGKVKVLVGHLNAHVRSHIAEMLSLLSLLTKSVLAFVNWANMPLLVSIQPAWSLSSIHKHIPGESPRLE